MVLMLTLKEEYTLKAFQALCTPSALCYWVQVERASRCKNGMMLSLIEAHQLFPLHKTKQYQYLRFHPEVHWWVRFITDMIHIKGFHPTASGEWHIHQNIHPTKAKLKGSIQWCRSAMVSGIYHPTFIQNSKVPIHWCTDGCCFTQTWELRAKQKVPFFAAQVT